MSCAWFTTSSAGGRAGHVGVGVAREEADPRLVDDAHEPAVAAPSPVQQVVGLQRGVEAFQGGHGLRLEGRVHHHDPGGDRRVQVGKVHQQVEQEFVLAGLAREHQDDRVAQVLLDGFEDAGKRLRLVRAQLDAQRLQDILLGMFHEIGHTAVQALAATRLAGLSLPLEDLLAMRRITAPAALLDLLPVFRVVPLRSGDLSLRVSMIGASLYLPCLIKVRLPPVRSPLSRRLGIGTVIEAVCSRFFSRFLA